MAGTAAGAGLLAGCGGARTAAVAGPVVVGRDGQARSSVSREAADPAAAAAAVGMVRAFGADLYRRLSPSAGNLVCAPYSVAVALAMTRNGARGRTAAEMDRVLHAPDPRQLNGGLGALGAVLEQRSGPVHRADGSAAEVALRVANSLWGQLDTAWQVAFLDALARHYGAGMRLVDYRTDPEGARARINAWTGEQTGGKIDQLVPPHVIDDLTRMVLVNAVYLKAPWERPFVPDLTRVLPFRRQDGSTVGVPTMTGMIRGARYGRGNGWQAADLRYAGNGLAMTVIVPDSGTLRTFEKGLDGDRVARIIGSLAPVGSLDIRLPAWKFRTRTPLKETLVALGMPTAFHPDAADFSAMTVQERLFIREVLHEAVIAVDESGTEASAATAVVFETLSRAPSVSMVVDRPFLFVIHDVPTGAPLFVGRVTDPAAKTPG